MPHALAVCSTPGCPELTTGGRCQDCKRAAEKKRGNFRQRGYTHQWDRRRAAYLRNHPVCILCGEPAKVPDHHPLSRRELVDLGVDDPDSDTHLRPLCWPCHSRETAQHQPGGWNNR